MTARPRLVLCVSALSFLACGGGGAGASRSPDAPTHAERSDSPEESSSPPRAPAPRVAPKPSCEDGSCFACGGGLCPSGFYCDDAAKGGAACSWVPACATSAGCDCLTRALGGGHCSLSGGGPHVTD